MKKFITKAIEIEKLAAEIYHEYAKNPLIDGRLKEIWQEMAKDEEDHALILKLALRVPQTEAFAGVREDGPDPDELKDLLMQIYERAKAGKNDEYEMLRDAVSLENNFRQFHAIYSLVFKDQDLLKTFKALARADELHLKALNEYLAEYKKNSKA